MCIHIYVYTHIYIFTYTHIHIYTYIYTHILQTVVPLVDMINYSGGAANVFFEMVDEGDALSVKTLREVRKVHKNKITRTKKRPTRRTKIPTK